MVELKAAFSGIASNIDLVKFLVLVGVLALDGRVVPGIWQLDNNDLSKCERFMEVLIS